MNDRTLANGKRVAENDQRVMLSQNFIVGLLHSVFRSVSSAAPTPQEMVAGLGRLVSRPLSVDYDRMEGKGIWIDPVGISNGNSVAHTLAGLMILLRSGASVSGDRFVVNRDFVLFIFYSFSFNSNIALLNYQPIRMILPRHNEWMSTVSESLVFSFENGYKAKDLIMLTPLLAELFFELCIRQSDSVPSIDAAFFELARVSVAIYVCLIYILF